MSEGGGQSRSPTRPEVLRAAIDSILSDTHTMLPGRIDEYDTAKQSVVVTPMVQRRVLHEDGTESLENIPPLPDVPLVFPRSKNAFVTFPVKKGDFVMLLFSERSLDNWLSSSSTEPVDPDEFRQHDLSDGVALPCLYPFGSAIKDIDGANLVLGFDEGGLQIHITPNGTMEIKVDGTADEVVVLGNALQMFWDTSVKPMYDAHVHPTGVGPSGPPAAPLPAFDTTALSTILKLKGG